MITAKVLWLAVGGAEGWGMGSGLWGSGLQALHPVSWMAGTNKAVPNYKPLNLYYMLGPAESFRLLQRLQLQQQLQLWLLRVFNTCRH